MNIKERLARREQQDIIHMGQVVEVALDGEFGEILEVLMNGRISREAQESRGGRLSADRHLGRIEMCEILMDDLNQFIADKAKLQMPLEEEDNRERV